jgi:hypothetical protein
MKNISSAAKQSSITLARRSHFPNLLLGLVLLLAAVFLQLDPLQAAPATSPPRVLILNETVAGGASSFEALAAAAAIPGCAVDLVSAANWYAIPASGTGGPTGFGFDQYRALVLGDPMDASGPGYLAALNALNATKTNWTPACAGNVLVMGTDSAHHAGAMVGAAKTIDRGIAFVVNDPAKTGFYYSLGSYYDYVAPAVLPTLMPHMTGFGTFKVRNYAGVCFNDAHIVATHPILTAVPPLTDAELSLWDCSTHEGFDVWPPSFIVLTIGLTPGAYTATDGSNGVPYMLVRGAGVKSIGPISLSPSDATNDLGTTHTVCASIATNVIPHAGVLVTFTIASGPNSVTNYSTVTDSNGVACFTYLGIGGKGLDYITATYTNSFGTVLSSGTVTKLWVGVCVDVDCPVVECLSDGVWNYQFCVTNLGATSLNNLSLFGAPAGVSFTPSLITLIPPLAGGQSTNLSVTIHGPITLSNICFQIGAHTTDEVVPLCDVPQCLTLPACCNRVITNSLTFASTIGLVTTYSYSVTIQNITGVPLRFVGFGADQPCVTFLPSLIDLTFPAYGTNLLLPGQTCTLNLQVKRTAPCPGTNSFHLSTFDTNFTACCSTKVTMPPAKCVQIVSPYGGSVLYPTSPVLVRARAFGPCELTWVKIFDGPTFVGDGTIGISPGGFDLTLTNLTPGIHQLTAVAELANGTQGAGEIETSDPVELTVLMPLPDPDHQPPTLAVGVTGNSVLISLPTSLGHAYSIEYSTNLAPGSWRTLRAIDGDGGTTTITDSVTNDDARFYRAVLQH